VRILRSWIPDDGVIGGNADPWLGAARYWSPFRRENEKAAFRAFTSAQEYCRTSG